ncbi:hypothetical protein ACRALDRAFT_1081068 [Sodiomyces alcalophilus JCM 7366]|uniref:uncharacterized protein n=1 Tax=Sodiomyces alcalophilus JCM 7366 TaxID=591952 RepID=UPI0039B40F6B
MAVVPPRYLTMYTVRTLVHTWLLNPRNPILPKVIESIRPLVLPKLREERERERTSKKNKKKSIKDVVVQDDFEVSIFLTETTTRHSLLTKQKHFRDKATSKLKSNSKKLTGMASDAPVDIDADGDTETEPIVLREESDEEPAVALEGIPPSAQETETVRPKRRRQTATYDDYDDDEDEDDEFRASSDDQDEADQDAGTGTIEIDSDDAGPPPPKRRRKQATDGGDDDETDDKKKLAMDVTFEGFAIYGRVLCLVVKKREGGAGGSSSSNSNNDTSRSTGKRTASAAAARADKPAGQAVMENWISSTQAPNPGAEEDAS